MGLSFAEMKVAPDRTLANAASVRFLVDSGAEYSVVPRTVLSGMGISPYRVVKIVLADGQTLEREAADAYFEYLGERAPSPVIFGEEADELLLGVVTLENLGFMLDPLQRRIIKRKVLRG